jgi:hypothetical protein
MIPKRKSTTGFYVHDDFVPAVMATLLLLWDQCFFEKRTRASVQGYISSLIYLVERLCWEPVRF